MMEKMPITARILNKIVEYLDLLDLHRLSYIFTAIFVLHTTKGGGETKCDE